MENNIWKNQVPPNMAPSPQEGYAQEERGTRTEFLSVRRILFSHVPSVLSTYLKAPKNKLRGTRKKDFVKIQ